MNTIQINKSIELINQGIYLNKEKIIILSDFHIGYEDSLIKQGVLIPKFHFKELHNTVENIFKILKKEKKEVKTIVINGDLKHEFGTISDEEWRNTLKILDYLKSKCENIILVKGNHDTILGPIADKRNVLVVEHLIHDNILICHGDKIPHIEPTVFKKIKTIIIGHEHPAVTISENIRQEKFKCFLLGNFKDKTLLVQPSLNPVTEGTDVYTEKLLSPFLDQDLSDFKAFIVADEIYEFGKLKNIK